MAVTFYSRNKTLSLVLITITVVFAAACREDSKPQNGADVQYDTSLETGHPCEPPCWYGIVPGQTTIEEARTVLPTLPFIDKESIEEHGSPQFDWTISWESPVGNEGGGISFDSSGKVSEITSSLGYPLELQELIQVRGEPDGIKGEWDLSYDWIDVRLYWFDEGYSVVIGTEVEPWDWPIKSPVEPEMLVRSVTYEEPVPNAETYFEELLRDFQGDFTRIGYFAWNDYQPVGEPHTPGIRAP